MILHEKMTMSDSQRHTIGIFISPILWKIFHFLGFISDKSYKFSWNRNAQPSGIKITLTVHLKYSEAILLKSLFESTLYIELFYCSLALYKSKVSSPITIHFNNFNHDSCYSFNDSHLSQILSPS